MHVSSLPSVKLASTLIAATFAVPVFAIEVDCVAAKNDSQVYVRIERANVLAQPSPDASKVATLTLGALTCALTSVRNDTTDWVFVRGYWKLSHHEPLQGWLPRNAIAYQTELKRLTRIQAQRISVNIGDYLAEYRVQESGAFSVNQVVSEHKCKKKEVPNEYGACEYWRVVRGKFIGVGILAIAQSKQNGRDDVFKLSDEGILCPWQLGSPPEQCR